MEMEHEFILGGKSFRTSRRAFEARLADARPEPIQKYSVMIGGRRFPIKQAVAVGLAAPRARFQSQDAFRVLDKLGFEPMEECP
jgi:hypothetical protein